ncbi:polysaccharide biosynthesis/export family protein [Bradyrhizobium sp. CER78]|uniref:polysaccharide biosynthesis/export family protein n=1 Tax=Bradyrhizobium sp. CER78 TaxID=3039162 RepID=UPI00244A8275|nr:polysaccharide biosynthesis/export family protein [Bradyrhizobium sp. CER78]MDH2379911.1 polysaccharide biosynthesis/export family protein [Bradyrhizobium sp. CER78]
MCVLLPGVTIVRCLLVVVPHLAPRSRTAMWPPALNAKAACMVVEQKSEPAKSAPARSTPPRSRRGRTSALLVVASLAVLVVAAGRNWGAVEIFSRATAQKAFAALGTRSDKPSPAAAQVAAVTAQDSPSGPPTATVAPSASPVLTIAERSKIATPVRDTPAADLCGVGDKLTIAFYERVDVEEDKWGRSSNSALRGLVQRPELSVPYTVQEDGTISVPLLGTIQVAGRSTQQVRTDLAESFDRLLGRKGVVNILSIERSPIYVLGPVKTPGSYKFVSGMTVLHAMALAGGLDRGTSEPWQKIEAVREVLKRSGTADAMLKLLARAAVLKAERDGVEPKIPLRLIELVGANEASNLVHEQGERRKAIATARANRERALQTALEAAKQDVVVYGRMEALDDLVKLRQDRANSMRALAERNVISATVLNQVQSELTDAEQRKREALNQYATAKQRLATLEAEGFRIQSDVRSDLELEIETIERQISDNEREYNISEGVLSTLPATRAQFTKEAERITYQVVRQTPTGPVAIESSGMTVLQPGDLLNVILSDGDAKSQANATEVNSSQVNSNQVNSNHANSPAPTTSPADRSSVGRATNRQEIGRAVADQASGPK